jgi:hypothetical protein
MGELDLDGALFAALDTAVQQWRQQEDERRRPEDGQHPLQGCQSVEHRTFQ